MCLCSLRVPFTFDPSYLLLKHASPQPPDHPPPNHPTQTLRLSRSKEWFLRLVDGMSAPRIPREGERDKREKGSAHGPQHVRYVFVDVIVVVAAVAAVDDDGPLECVIIA